MDTFDDNYEKLFGELNTPRKTSNDISRFNDNTFSFLSPSTKRLHQDPPRVVVVTTGGLRAVAAAAAAAAAAVARKWAWDARMMR